MAKEQKTKENSEQTICAGCIKPFDEKELTTVLIKKEYTAPYCEKCVTENEFPKEDLKGNAFKFRVDLTKKYNTIS